MMHFLQVYFAIGVGLLVGEIINKSPRLTGWFHAICSVIIMLVFWPLLMIYAVRVMRRRGDL